MSDVQTILRPARRPLLPRAGRCHECGQRARELCSTHPTAERVTLTPGEIRAFHYISWLRNNDGFVEESQDSSLPVPTLEQVTRWIETYNAALTPGTTVGELALAALHWDRWGRKPLREIDYGPTPWVRAESAGRL